MKHMAREQITWHTAQVETFPFYFQHFLFFLWPSSSAWSHVRNCPGKEDFLTISTHRAWATAQMNGHYVDLKWKLGLKWICNELNPSKPSTANSVRCRELSLSTAKDMLQLNKKKITLKRCGVSPRERAKGGERGGLELLCPGLVSICWLPLIEFHSSKANRISRSN